MPVHSMFGNMSVAHRAYMGSASSADLCTPLIHARQKIAELKIRELRIACAQKDACIQQLKQEIATLKLSLKAQKRESEKQLKHIEHAQATQKTKPKHSVQTQTGGTCVCDSISDDVESEGWVSC